MLHLFASSTLLVTVDFIVRTRQQTRLEFRWRELGLGILIQLSNTIGFTTI